MAKRISIGRAELAVCMIVCMAMTRSAKCQEVIWQKDADEQTPSFGAALAFFPDQNGDGIVDLLLGYTGNSCNNDSGMVYLLSGADGSELNSICGGDPGGACVFGTSIAVLPDLDQDGVPEFIVGDPLFDNYQNGDTYAGGAFVYSGASWQPISEFVGEAKENRFGSSVTTISDLDSDGLDDFIVAAPALSWAFPLAAGRVYIYSSASGNVLRTHSGEKDLDGLGLPTRVRDVDLDGVDDYAVKSQLTDVADHGEVELYSGASGKLIHNWEGDATFDLGVSITDAGDLNSDGISDLLIAGVGPAATESGYLFAYSGADESELFLLRGALPGDWFGSSVASVGDMNRDGVAEFLVGAFLDGRIGKNAGSATLYSGRTARALYTFFPDYTEGTFGSKVYGGVDLDGDGIPDLLIKAGQTPPKKGKRMGGRVTAFAGNDLFLQADLRTPLPGDTVTIATRGGESGALTLLALIDVSGAPLFLPLYLSTLDTNGESELAASIPAAASGLDFTLLAYAQKHAGGRGLIDSWTETISVQ